MPRKFTRRDWLTTSVVSLAGLTMWRVSAAAQQLPPGFGVAATPPCDPSTKPTPARTLTGYRAVSPARTKITEVGEPGSVLNITGAVIGLRCGLIPGATIDVWQADANGAVDASGTRLRGRQLTDAEGKYRIETIVPGAIAGQAPRVNLRITVPGKATLNTSVFLPDAVAGAANKKDAAFDPLLAMTLVDRTAARISASFNVILDL